MERATKPVRMLILGLALLLSSCGSSEKEAVSAGPLGSHLKIGVGRDFYEGPDSRTHLHGSTHVWEALTYFDDRLLPVGWLAESWEAPEDGKVWIFRLRPGVRFHNGDSLTPEAVVLNIRRLQEHPQYDPLGTMKNLLSVEASGSDRVVFRLKDPLPGFAGLLAYYGSPVFHPKVIDSQGRITQPVATGSFKVDRIDPGDSIHLSAFAEYWGEKPHFENVSFKYLPDAQSRLMALLTGETDAIADVGGILPAQLAEIKDHPQIVVKMREVATTHYLLFNCAKAPFSQKTSRQWLAHLLDRRQLVHTLTEGVGIVADSFYSPLAHQWAFHHPDLGSLKEDVEMPSVTDPVIILLHGGLIQRWPYLSMAQVMEERLRGSGLAVRIQVRESGAYLKAYQQGEFDITLQPNTMMTGDPDFFYSSYLTSDAVRNTGYSNPKLDRLVKEARHETDLQRRIALYRELSSMTAEELPVIPLYHDVALYAHRKTIDDFHLDASFRPGLLQARPSQEE